MSEVVPTISTHVLDTGSGQPAVGVRVTLGRLLDDGALVPAGEARTDGDGRIRSLLVGELTSGDYVLAFHLDDHGRFFQRVTLEVHVDDPTRSYHVPLLLAPFGVSAYRGS